MRHEVVPPDAAGTIESLSALGYSLESAIADIVDNSLDASASRVDITFHWAGTKSFVAIVDNGTGMTEDALVGAMAIAARGPRADRASSELGRFGMGLKTASFSQASTLIVWSKAVGAGAATRIWDLDHVVEARSWQLLRTPNAADQEVVARLSKSVTRSGTIVLWRGLTKLVDDLGEDDESAHRHFLEAVERVQQHLSMTFARFLKGAARRANSGQIHLLINGSSVFPWDPFMESHKATVQKQVERLEIDGCEVAVRPFILPPKRLLTNEEYIGGGGPQGWLDQQGFYVYRNDRLILPGSWLDFRGLRKDEKHVLARIAIEMPSALDRLWSIDVRKASARPPLPLRASLLLTAKATRADAQRRMSSISRTAAAQHTDELSYVWKPQRKDGELRLKLNWTHPLVQQALQTSLDARPIVHALLRYMEETVPIPALRTMFDAEADRDYSPFEGAPPQEVITVAERLYGAYISKGLTPLQAATRLKHTPPFDEYPDIAALLNLPNNPMK